MNDNFIAFAREYFQKDEGVLYTASKSQGKYNGISIRFHVGDIYIRVALLMGPRKGFKESLEILDKKGLKFLQLESISGNLTDLSQLGILIPRKTRHNIEKVTNAFRDELSNRMKSWIERGEDQLRVHMKGWEANGPSESVNAILIGQFESNRSRH